MEVTLVVWKQSFLSFTLQPLQESKRMVGVQYILLMILQHGLFCTGQLWKAAQMFVGGY